MKLCEAYHQTGQSAEGSAQQRQASSIWEFLVREELWALSEIVGHWSQGTLDAHAARRQFQYRVVRGRVGVSSSSSRQAGSLHSHLLGLGANEVEAEMFASFLTPPPPRAARPQTTSEDVSNEALEMIDDIFLCSSFREARSLAVREMALDDGNRVLPEEMMLSFQEKVRDIMRSPSSERRAATGVWLNLIRLCLCAEVIRHLKPSCQGRPAGPPARAIGVMELGLPLGGVGSMLASAPGHHSGVNFLMTRNAHSGIHVVAVSGFGGPTNADQMVSIRGAGPGSLAGAAAPGVRMDPMFLRERVHAMLEILALNSTLQSRAAAEGMTPADIDRCCPVTNFQGTESMICPVCLDEMEVGGRIRSLPCGHVLHVECCDSWLATAETCPTCRHQLRGRGNAD